MLEQCEKSFLNSIVISGREVQSFHCLLPKAREAFYQDFASRHSTESSFTNHDSYTIESLLLDPLWDQTFNRMHASCSGSTSHFFHQPIYLQLFAYFIAYLTKNSEQSLIRITSIWRTVTSNINRMGFQVFQSVRSGVAILEKYF